MFTNFVLVNKQMFTNQKTMIFTSVHQHFCCRSYLSLLLLLLLLLPSLPLAVAAAVAATSFSQLLLLCARLA